MPASKDQIKEFLKLFDSPDSAIQALQSYHQPIKPTRRSGASRGAVILKVEQVTKQYRRGKQTVSALEGVSLEVHAGEFVALTGASGSGKSTLLQLMGGLDKPTLGRITIADTDVNELKDEALSEFRNRTVGFVFQFFYLQPFLSVAKNIEVPGMFAHNDRPSRLARIHELLDTVGLADQAQQLPKQLSGGQIQRAAVARALLNNPKILLADEPTGNLDSKNSAAIIELFKRIRRDFGTTIVIVTHNPDIAAQADTEIRLHDGRLM
jgi:putative ABC transport system ATP-binding protein